MKKREKSKEIQSGGGPGRGEWAQPKAKTRVFCKFVYVYRTLQLQHALHAAPPASTPTQPPACLALSISWPF